MTREAERSQDRQLAKLETQTNRCFSSSLEGKPRVPGPQSGRRHACHSAFLLIQDFNRLDEAHPPGEIIFFAQPTNLNVILTQKRHHRHTQNYVFTRSLGIPWSLKLTQKINQHRAR